MRLRFYVTQILIGGLVCILLGVFLYSLSVEGVDDLGLHAADFIPTTVPELFHDDSHKMDGRGAIFLAGFILLVLFGAGFFKVFQDINEKR